MKLASEISSIFKRQEKALLLQNPVSNVSYEPWVMALRLRGIMWYMHSVSWVTHVRKHQVPSESLFTNGKHRPESKVKAWVSILRNSNVPLLLWNTATASGQDRNVYPILPEKFSAIFHIYHHIYHPVAAYLDFLCLTFCINSVHRSQLLDCCSQESRRSKNTLFIIFRNKVLQL